MSWVPGHTCPPHPACAASLLPSGCLGWHRAIDGHIACALVDLASVLTPEIMAPILANADVQERLLPYLPSGESLPQTADEIQNTLTSPQFQQVCMPVARSAHCWLPSALGGLP